MSLRLRLAISLCSLALLTAAGSSADAQQTPGRAGPGPAFSAKRLVQSFRGPREFPRQKALREVVRFHLDDDDPALPPALADAVGAACESGRAGGSVLAAIQLLGRFRDASSGARLVSLLSEDDPRLVMTAADGLARRGDPSAVDALRGLAGREEFRRSYAFRHAVVSAVGRLPSPEAVDFLVDLLPEADGQLRYEAARRLSALTGENFGGRIDDWRVWWVAHREGFEAVPAPPASRAASAGESPAAMPWEYEPPEFFGTPIYAKRVVFVVDVSRSMASSADGVTRLERVREELREAVEGLPPDAAFDVLAYNTDVTPWKGELVPADAAAKRDALLFAELLEPERKTACYDALEAGLAHAGEPEVLLFLSDGEPTAGRIVDRDAIVEAVTAANTFRRVTIDVVGVDARDRDLKFLEDLARRNFGELRVVR